MIELLIAIGIIAILAGILFLGLRSVTTTAQGGSTKITLQVLQNMLVEYDTKTRLNRPPQAWRWFGTATSSDVSAPGVGPLMAPYDYDFWRIPARVVGAVGTARNPDSLDAPGSVAETEEVTRNGCRQVLNTQIAMAMLLGVPANRAAMEKLPADRYFTPKWVAGNVATPAADGVLMTTGDGQEAVYYLLGAKAEHNGVKVRCITGHASPSGPSSPGGQWSADATPAAPLLRDAWNNPIIFVPGTGLRVRLLNGTSVYQNSDGTVPPEVITAIVVSPEGKTSRQTPNNVTTPPIVTQPGRPFFASAGPDGDFAKGDDNMYSFEQ